MRKLYLKERTSRLVWNERVIDAMRIAILSPGGCSMMPGVSPLYLCPPASSEDKEESTPRHGPLHMEEERRWKIAERTLLLALLSIQKHRRALSPCWSQWDVGVLHHLLSLRDKSDLPVRKCGSPTPSDLCHKVYRHAQGINSPFQVGTCARSAAALRTLPYLSTFIG